MATYIVYVSGHAKLKLDASSGKEAKRKAWEQIKDFYTYGWRNKTEFMRGVTARKVEETD